MFLSFAEHQVVGRPCVPFDKQSANGPLIQRIEATISKIWQTEYNYTVHDRLPADDRVRCFLRWAEESKKNPLFVLDVPWVNNNNRLTELVAGNLKDQEKPVQSADFQSASSQFVKEATKILSELGKKKEPPPSTSVHGTTKKRMVADWDYGYKDTRNFYYDIAKYSMAKLRGDLGVYRELDPDDLYKPGSMTFFYVPHSKNLYVEPYPTSHRDMLSDNDDLFDDVYGGRSVTSRQRASLVSRGQALENSDALLGRIGAAGDAIVIAFWNDPQPEHFGNFLDKLFRQYPHFRQVQDKVLVVRANQPPVMLVDLIGPGERPPRPKRAIQMAPERPASDRKVFEIDGQKYSLSDLQQLRASIHTKGPVNHLPPAMSVLCHPDLANYPELQGYKPAGCHGPAPAGAIKGPAAWRHAGRAAGLPYIYSYGEGLTLRDWIAFQEAFSQ